MPTETEPRRRALVTGGAQRLGSSMALDLARRGWDIDLHFYQSEVAARETALKIGHCGRRARLHCADLSAPGGVEALVERLEDSPPTLVVHSASYWFEDDLGTVERETWESIHRLHSWVLLVLGKALGRWGRPAQLVSLLDARIYDRDSRHWSYSFAKRESADLTRLLALELAPTVRVNGIAPGLVLRSDATTAAVWNQAAQKSTPLAKAGSPRDVVRALRFLVDSPFITGQVITVDGGRHLKGDLFGTF